jgi:16S rRNA C967 or C1407 C5-methylase (RsmB/RsmF family)
MKSFYNKQKGVKLMNELFKNRMKELLKDEYDDFISSLEKPPVKAFYLNTNKKNILDYLNKDYIYKHPIVDNGYYFDYDNYPLGKSPYFLSGLYYIQEPSAMLVSQIIDIKIMF